MKALLTLTLLSGILNASAQTPLTESQIDSLVGKTLSTFKVPGIAVAVVKDGQVVLAKGYGVRSLNSKTPVDAHTAFGIASNTKAFTATALGMLVEEGKLKWDDKVIKYIPEFKLYDPWVTKEFTIRDLLTHRSGMGLGAGDLMFFPDSADFTTKDIIHNLRYLKPVSSFRSKFDYDNNLYTVAGEVLKRVSGQSWSDFIQQRILTPLGMNGSAPYYARLADKTNVIDAHAPVDGTVRVIPRHYDPEGGPAGSIYSNVNDLAKWVQVQLAHGRYGTPQKQLFSDAVHEETWAAQTILPVGGPGYYNVHFRAYALGFFLSDVKGYKQVEHTGGLEGMVTEITMLPELKLGIIVLTNQQEGGAFYTITNSIKDGYLGLPQRDWLERISKATKGDQAEAKQLTDSIWRDITAMQQKAGSTNVTRYAGTYRDPWLGDILITQKDGGLYFQSKRSPKLGGPMYFYKDSTFIVKWVNRSMDADAFVHFSANKSGRITGATMKAVSPLTDFSYDFHDLELKRVK
ncbi:MAG: serine hydrolase [Chitinophagaceae bacterium]|nr:MAG: serine hydrolase [Chitinophagaceae bacterium]